VNSEFTLRNRQHTHAVDLRRLRIIVTTLLGDLLGQSGYDLGLYLVSTPEITRLNQTWLGHSGPTDVITFDYASAARPTSGRLAPKPSAPRKAGPREISLHGEIFICIDEAFAQARRFRTHWTSELARYIIHGLLHLQGYDDLEATDRRRMKQNEERVLRRLARRFDLRQLAR